MKYLITLVTFSFFLNSSFGATCSNKHFLKQRVEIEFSESSWFMNGCELVETEEGLHPLLGDDQKCQLINLSRPNELREVLNLELGQKFLESGSGYIKISLDNSFAEYGPRKLSSFLFCE